MAQVEALMWKLVLEKLRPREVLEIRVVDPAIANAFVGEPVNVLQQQKPDHEPSFDPRPTLVAVERCDLAIEKLPVNLLCQLHQLMLHVDDLVQPRPEQITRSRRLVLLRPHASLRCGDGITLADSRESQK